MSNLTNKQLLALNADLTAQLAAALDAVAELTFKLSEVPATPAAPVAHAAPATPATPAAHAAPAEVVAPLMLEITRGLNWIDRTCVYISTAAAIAKRAVLAALYRGSNRTVRNNGCSVTVRTYC